jgi:hypothetical protein
MEILVVEDDKDAAACLKKALLEAGPPLGEPCEDG